ncbi:MAG TPA: hypothetical protein PLK25_00785 [Bacteroidales bacterium]|nr:hypothetical protein [Bacteroidales bacterium]OQC47040.1 MAG: hypothetical protein BWX61_00563 [Bacteroidetes bacterium ADurb.Bin035]MBP8946213.1 hypothetical protein [Bacteroidales bacterium]HNW21031.1 hypothetical protein [Bacteroidales bacterium]HNY76292.1 hypothetical protein [Bacteroidales bacterium]
MEEIAIQNQINELNEKVDTLLEYIIAQNKKNQAIDDFIDDAYKVGIDLFKTTAVELDNHGVEVDMDEVKILIFKLLKNIQTFNTLINMLESMVDLMKDATPIAREMIIDLTYQLDKLEKNGTIESLKTITTNLTNPDLLQSLAKISSAITNVKPDEKLDNISMFKLMKSLNNREVKNSLSYLIRILQEINKKQ